MYFWLHYAYLSSRRRRTWCQQDSTFSFFFFFFFVISSFFFFSSSSPTPPSETYGTFLFIHKIVPQPEGQILILSNCILLFTGCGLPTYASSLNKFPCYLSSVLFGKNVLLFTGKGFPWCGHSAFGSTVVEVPGSACVGPGGCWSTWYWDHVRLPFWITGESLEDKFNLCKVVGQPIKWLYCAIKYLKKVVMFKVCKSVHHRTIPINQPTRCNSFPSLLLDVYVRFNIFRASSRPSSGAQQLQ